MLLETRLARCIAYREIALEKPNENRLYIEDLELSIKMFKAGLAKPVFTGKGWIDDDS